MEAVLTATTDATGAGSFDDRGSVALRVIAAACTAPLRGGLLSSVRRTPWISHPDQRRPACALVFNVASKNFFGAAHCRRDLLDCRNVEAGRTLVIYACCSILAELCSRPDRWRQSPRGQVSAGRWPGPPARCAHRCGVGIRSCSAVAVGDSGTTGRDRLGGRRHPTERRRGPPV